MMDGRSFEAVPKELKESKQWCLWRSQTTGDSEKASKIPYQVNGRKAKSDDPTTWNTFDNCLAAYRKNPKGYAGLGRFFSDQESIIGIDFDNGLNDASEVLPWCAELLGIVSPVAYIETSPSGRGMKAWLNTGHWREIRDKRFDFNAAAGQRIEVYSCGRFFTVTGDAWVPGIEGPLPDAGDVFNTFMDRLAELCPKATKIRKPATVAMVHHAGGDDPSHWPPIEERIERARLYLDQCPEAIDGQGGQNQTMAVAGAVAVGFALSEDQAFQVMQDWNARCLPPWSEHDLRRKISEAQKTSQKPTGHLLDDRWQFDDPSDVDISGFLAKRSAPSQQHDGGADSQGQAVDQSDAQPPHPLEGHPALQAIREKIVRFRDGVLGWDAHGAYLKHQRQQSSEEPTQLPEPPEGFLRDFTAYIVANAPKAQPAFAQMAAVCTLGTLIGRKVQTSKGLQANLFVLCIGESGTGKDYPRSQVKKLLNTAASGKHVLAEEPGSSNAFLKDVVNHPSCVWLADEFNKVLASLKDPRASHLAQVLRLMLVFWNPQDGPGTKISFSDRSKNVSSEGEHFSLFATGTPDGMFENFSTSDVNDGLIPRMMFVIGDRDAKFQGNDLDFTMPTPEIPKQIIGHAKAWGAPMLGTTDFRQDMPATPHTVPLTKEAASLLLMFRRDAEQERELSTEAAGLWSRAFEKVWKLALIAACSQYGFQVGGGIDLDAINIDETHVAWAIEVVRTITEGMVRAITGKVGATPRERHLLKLERIIKEGKDGGVARSAITRKMQGIGSLKYREDLLADLVRGEKVSSKKGKQTKGNTALIYVHADFMPVAAE